MTWRMLVLGLLVVIACQVMVTLAVATSRDHVVVRIPVCEEDEGYLQGRGDFDGLRWDRYRCIHNEVVNP